MNNKKLPGELDPSMSSFLVEIKAALHEINRSFYQGARGPMIALDYLAIIFIESYIFRDQFHHNREKITSSLDRVIGQTSRMQLLYENKIEHNVLVKEYLILRKFIARLEKEIIRWQYFKDTNRITKKIGSIPMASKISGKSEVTIRRYIFSGKITAYKVTKKWWIPLEELDKVKKGGR